MDAAIAGCRPEEMPVIAGRSQAVADVVPARAEP